MGKCKFLLGLGIGAVIGVLCYRFSRTDKAREWKEKACHAAKKMGGRVNDAMDSVKEKMAGTVG